MGRILEEFKMDLYENGRHPYSKNVVMARNKVWGHFWSKYKSDNIIRHQYQIYEILEKVEIKIMGKSSLTNLQSINEWLSKYR